MTTFSALAPALADLALRGSVILLVGAGLTMLLRRASAASRHLVWSGALAALVILPVARMVAPAWTIAVLPPILAPGAGGVASAVHAAVPADATVSPNGTAPSGVERAAATPTVAAPDATSRVTPPAPAGLAGPWTPASVAVALWLSGIALLLVRIAWGTIGVARIARRAEPADDAGLVLAARRIARELGVRRPVTVLVAPDECIPVTWGVLYPTVLLPESAVGWDAERRTLVLTHELGHVARLDAVMLVVAQLAVALNWFNPLAWLAARRARTERERACDDLVLAHGVRPSRYADDLLTLVRSLRPPRAPAFAALAMARRSEFEGRLLAILDPVTRRGGVSLIGAVAALSAFAVVMPAAAVEPTTRAPQGATATAGRARTDSATRASAAGRATRATPARASSPSGSATTSTSASATTPASAGRPASVSAPASARSSASSSGAATATATASRSARASRVASAVSELFGSGCHLMSNGSRHISHHDDDGYFSISISDDKHCLTMDGHGEVAYTDADDDIASLSPRGRVRISEEVDGVQYDYVVTSDAQGQLTKRFRRDDEERPTAEAHEWLARLVPELARNTGVGAAARVTRLRKKGGVAAVLADAHLIDSDGAKRTYLELLLKGGGLTTDELRQVVGEASTISSDGDKRVVLEKALDAGGSALADATATAAGTISSDGDRAAVLVHVVNQLGVKGTLPGTFFTSAEEIGSDGDKSNVLLAVLRTSAVSPDNLQKALEVARTIGSDGDKANVLLAVARYPGTTNAAVLQLLDVAKGIGSDGDKANVLRTIARQSAGADSTVRSAIRKVAKTIGSDGDYRSVMDALDR